MIDEKFVEALREFYKAQKTLEQAQLKQSKDNSINGQAVAVAQGAVTTKKKIMQDVLL